MTIKFSGAVILYVVALLLFLFGAIGSEVGGIGFQGLGLASLAGGLIMDQWTRH